MDYLGKHPCKAALQTAGRQRSCTLLCEERLGRDSKEWGHLCTPPSAWENTSGESKELTLQDKWAACPCPPTASPATQPDVDIPSVLYGDIPELGLVREERALSSLYMTTCSCQVHANMVSLCSKWQLNTQNYREGFLGDLWEQGEILLLCAPGDPVTTSDSG